jgi:hypothetical protein
MRASAADSACQVRRDLVAAAGTLARIIDGHPRPSDWATSIDGITLSDERDQKRLPCRFRGWFCLGAAAGCLA